MIFQGTAAALAALLFFAATALAATPPRFDCDPLVHDFGEVDPSQIQNHAFTIRNTGGSQLLIKKIRAACGCTAFRWDTKTPIPPGGLAMLPVSLSLAGRRGLQEKTIDLETNDPANPRVQLILRATVSTRLEINPPVLVLRRESPGGPLEGEVTITSPARKKLTPSETRSQSGRLDISTSPTDAGGFVLSARLQGDMPPGAHADSILVKTGDRENPECAIDVLISIPEEFAVVPSVCRLTGSSPATRTFIVKSADSQPFEIDSVELPEPSMSWTSTPAGPSARRLTVSNILPSPALHGKNISVRLSGPQPRTLEIPIHVTAHPGDSHP